MAERVWKGHTAQQFIDHAMWLIALAQGGRHEETARAMVHPVCCVGELPTHSHDAALASAQFYLGHAMEMTAVTAAEGKTQ